MKLKWTYQYISLNQPAQKILQTLRKCATNSIIPILDVEDSLQIPLDPDKTFMLKEKARTILSRIVTDVRAKKIDLRSSIRINALDTNEFGNDIDLLRDLKPLLCWDSIFLPKVHTAEVLKQYIHALKDIHYQELVVMAESRAFFEHTQEIIQVCKANNIQKVHFGHWDYFYDMKVFPVPLPDDEALWHRVSSLVLSLEKEDMHYLHTPFCFLINHENFQSIVRYLDSLTSLPFGLTTLSFSQALSVSRTGEGVVPIVPRPYHLSREEKVNMAKALVKFFNRPVPPEFSFNIDTDLYRFYAPHEYLSALEFLERDQG